MSLAMPFKPLAQQDCLAVAAVVVVVVVVVHPSRPLPHHDWLAAAWVPTGGMPGGGA